MRPESTFERPMSAWESASMLAVAIRQRTQRRGFTVMRTERDTVIVTTPASTHWNAYCPRCIDPEAMRPDNHTRDHVGLLVFAGDRQGEVARPAIWGHPHGGRHPDGWPWYGEAKPRRWSEASRWWDPGTEASAGRRRAYTRPIRLPAVVDCWVCGQPVLIQRLAESVDVR